MYPLKWLPCLLISTNYNHWQKVFGHSQKSAYDWFFNAYFSFEQPPAPFPPNNVAFGEITFTVEVIVLLENIIMAVINIVLGGKGGIKSK